MSISDFFLKIFTWWNGQTIGTMLHTARNGVRVGEDGQGNVYYRNRDDSRRWVIYNGEAEASKIPSGWHGWMHHRTDVAPVDEEYKLRFWEKPHQENLTGTARAYRPKGSILTPSSRPAVTGDYQSWSPGD